MAESKKQSKQPKVKKNNGKDTEKFPFKVTTKLSVVVKSRREVHYDGKAISLTSNNETGVFDVLPQHANFITMIKDFIEIYKSEKDIKTIKIKRGIMRVYNGNVEVYLTI